MVLTCVHTLFGPHVLIFFSGIPLHPVVEARSGGRPAHLSHTSAVAERKGPVKLCGCSCVGCWALCLNSGIWYNLQSTLTLPLRVAEKHLCCFVSLTQWLVLAWQSLFSSGGSHLDLRVGSASFAGMFPKASLMYWRMVTCISCLSHHHVDLDLGGGALLLLPGCKCFGGIYIYMYRLSAVWNHLGAYFNSVLIKVCSATGEFLIKSKLVCQTGCEQMLTPCKYNDILKDVNHHVALI